MTRQTAMEIARKVMDYPDEILEPIIWNKTGFPIFWDIGKDGATPEECLETQLKRLKEEIASRDKTGTAV